MSQIRGKRMVSSLFTLAAPVRPRIPSHHFHRLIQIADREWKGILRFGRHCGLDPLDCVRLSHRAFRSNYQFLETTSEVGIQISTPLGSQLIRYLKSLPTPENSDAPLFPGNLNKSVAELEQHFLRMLVQVDASYSGGQLDFSALYFPIYHAR
jgi:hypothetical protein